MPTWIALFRGINVGGKNTLPMRDLVPLLEQRGCTDIRTYIQSGNVVFQSSESKGESLARRIASSIERQLGFDPLVFLLGEKDLAKAIANNPYPEAESSPKNLHLFFMAEKPKNPDLTALKKLKAEGESFAIKGLVLYLHTPGGFAASKLAANVERLLGVPVTARNWQTASKVNEMAESRG